MEEKQFKKYIYSYIKLLGLYLNQKEAINLIINDDDFSFFSRLSKLHSLKALLYQALLETKVQVNSEHLKKLEHHYLSALRKDVLFEQERKELFRFLNETSIDYLPLKGVALRNYYFDPHTREFADNDVLFKGEDEEIRDFFLKRDYDNPVFRKSNEDVYIKKPFFNFEMHRALFGGTDNGK